MPDATQPHNNGSEIVIPRRSDSLTPEEAVNTITEGIELVGMMLGGYSSGAKFPPWLVARAHRFFSVQAFRPERRGRGCTCSACYSDCLDHFLDQL